MPNRKCGVCGLDYPAKGKRRLYCSRDCAEKRQKEQLKALADRRKAERPERRSTCAVCSRPFRSRHVKHLYCGAPCRAVGLERAVERQRQRRAAAKSTSAE